MPNKFNDYFKIIVKKNASKIAIDTDYSKITFNELDINSDKISRVLSYKLKIKKNDRVCISSNKEIFNFILLISCLKIGASITFLDSSSPRDRIFNLIYQLNPKLIISNDVLSKKIRHKFKNIIYTKDELRTLSAKIKNYKINYANTDAIAYIMFTSGSTGEPKGVPISQKKLLNFAKIAKKELNIDDNDVFSNINPLYFDNSVFDVYASILNGCKMIPIESFDLFSPIELFKKLKKKKVTIWFSVPTLISYLIKFNNWNEKSIPSLKKIIFGGEVFAKNDLKKIFYKLKKVRFISVYGPTEGTCICSSYVVSKKDFSKTEMGKYLPLGKKLWKSFKFSLQNNGKNVKKNNIIAELLITGENVASGYLGKKYKDKFFNSSKNKYKSIYTYKTGDLVFIDKNRNIRFVGRSDNQIKYKGYRIELEDIQSTINKINEVNNNLVTFGNREKSQEITCWISLKKKIDIKKKISKLLPSYMLPHKFIFVKEFPKNANGKISRIELVKNYYDR